MTPAPDLIMINGIIRTQDDRHPLAQALAVTGSRISAVGQNSDIQSLASDRTRIIDLDGRLVLPGLIDTHFHCFEYAVNYNSINLAKVPTYAALEAAIAEKARQLGPGRWILGQGFNESDWPENRMPDRHTLDQAAPHNPVCIWRSDLHLAVASSSALDLAGIDRLMPDPPEGIIVRDPDGNPTGVLKELAPNMIRDVLPDLTDANLIENMRKAVSDLNRLGLTGIHDIRLMGDKDGARALRTWQQLAADDRLDIRCHVTLPGEMTEQAINLGLTTGFGSDRLRIGHLKFFADGGMGARTAWMTQDYLDAGSGMPLTPIDEMEQAVRKADRAGLSAMIHAVGDRACREVIALFHRIEARGGSRCRIPHRIEHVQMILPQDLQELGKLRNVAVSCQPNNLSIDISMIEMSAGERGRYTYNLKSILGTGIPMMLSSDAPVSDPNPFCGIFSAVTRKRMDRTPKEGYYPKEALSVDQAVRGYTLTPALACGCGDRLGSLTPGKLADVVVVDRDIYSIDPDTIPEALVDLTLVDGSVVHER